MKIRIKPFKDSVGMMLELESEFESESHQLLNLVSKHNMTMAFNFSCVCLGLTDNDPVKVYFTLGK